MKYSIDWQENAQNIAPEEAATAADFRLWIENQNATLHLEGDQSFDYLTIALYPLVEGLVHDWWTLFGGRDHKLSLVKFRSGFAVPDIRLSFDGAVFEISAHQRIYQNPDVRFWAGSTEIMDRATAEAILDDFIKDVLGKLAGRGLKRTSAQLRWKRIQQSRNDRDEAAFCEAAGSIGVDPYQIGDYVSAEIERASSLFEGEPLPEFLAGAGPTSRDELFDWIKAVERRPSYAARVGDLRPVSQEAAKLSPSQKFEQSWVLGYRRARAVRRVLQLKEKDRFRSFRPLAQLLGAKNQFELADRTNGLRALRTDKKDAVYIHMRTHGYSNEAKASHLFSFARAVGDVACFPEPSRAAINDLHEAYRQAAGRAFAAEFLAPINEIYAMKEDGKDIVSIADEFSVSAAVVEHQLENKSRIELACANGA